MNLEGKVAVVTGGADGIGFCAAQAFAKRGARVAIGDVNEDKLNASVEELGAIGVKCDVRQGDDVARLAREANKLGDVELVMANAGVAVGGRFDRIPIDEWQRLFDVNVFGVVRTINAFLPDMMERGSGTIVITGSGAGLFNSDGRNAPYASSKYALQGMSRALAVYAKEHGINVHYLAPRLTNTGFPLSSVAWGRKGSHVTSDRDIGDDYDTVDDVVEALLHGIAEGRFLISLASDTEERLAAFARTGSPF